MKKLLAILLVLVTLFSSAIALAEGAQTDKPIKFMDFTFGDTFKNIRSNTRLFCIDFLYGQQNARVVSDALYIFAEREDFVQKRTIPSCFFARTSETFKVAGHDVGTMLWFVYPFQNGRWVFDEDEAVFYAGVYEFHRWDDLVSIYADVKSKMTVLYGDPFYTGESLDEIMGRPPFSSGITSWYNSDNAKFKPEYTVWKSAANGVYAVLSFWHDTNSNENNLKLAYVSDCAEEHFDYMEKLGVFGEAVNGSDVDFSMEGL